MLRECKSVYGVGEKSTPRVGVIGGGQLARMLFEASVPLEIDVRVLVRHESDAAATVARDVVVGDWQDLATLVEFAESCAVVTFDHELVSPGVLQALEAAGVVLHPSASAMTLASDKATQRDLARAVGIRVISHATAADRPALRAAVSDIGFPAVVKATRGGYDGRAVWWVRGPSDLAALADAYDFSDGLLLVEPALDISAELATLVVRRGNGELVRYPVVRTEQSDGICVSVTAPAATTAELARQAQDGAAALADVLGYVGVLAVEYFVVGGELFLNELAPRPHNSGHYTIDACVTSQFENHLRAVLDWPLGDPSMITPAAVMANLIATSPRRIPLSDIKLPPGASAHLYGKTPSPDRKVGHVTVCGADRVVLRRTALEVAHQLTGPALEPVGPLGPAAAR